VQHGDGRVAVQDAFVLGVAQFIDARLLLGQQFAAINRGTVAAMPPSNGLSRRKWAMGSADHDLGRHAADIDAGADGAALDQRDVRALLDGLQRRRHRGSAAANDGDVQSVPITTSLVATAQPSQRLAEQSAPR
jgi:hypothetical protein